MPRGLTGDPAADLLVSLADGDDTAVVSVRDGLAVVAAADFFTPGGGRRAHPGPPLTAAGTRAGGG